MDNPSLSGTIGSADNSTPPINALPAELFLDILLETIDFEISLLPQLHAIAQVCTYWFQSIISNPRFWRVIDLETANLAPMVIRRNSDGPLTARCCVKFPEGPTEDFVDIVRGQAHRLDGLVLSGHLGESRISLFDFPMLALATLSVMITHIQVPTFPLSSSSALKHVEAWGIRFPWDSPCFSGLRSISIQASDPSFRQIVTAFSTSTYLEWLSLRDIEGLEVSEDDMDAVEPPLSLPALRGLYLQRGITSSMTNRLLTAINAPQCRILDATIPFHLIQHPGPTFSKLASIPISIADSIKVYYYGVHAVVEISSPLLPGIQYRNGWRSEGNDPRVSLSIGGVPYPSPNGLRSIATVLPLNLEQADVMIKLYYSEQSANAADLFGNHPAIWDSATHIYFDSSYRAEKIVSDLQFLATPVIENGRGTWPCARLTCIEMNSSPGAWAERVAHVILEFLKMRSAQRVNAEGSSTGAEIVWEIPVPLELVKAKEDVLCLVRDLEPTNGVHFVSTL